tara:strand:- start:137374 stop:139215 length:1842 start_codon:yes stop_codon:yes gene_type:complete
MASDGQLVVDPSARGAVLGSCDIKIPDGARLHIDGLGTEIRDTKLKLNAKEIATVHLTAPVAPDDMRMVVRGAEKAQSGHYIYTKWGLAGDNFGRVPFTDHNEIVDVQFNRNGTQTLRLKYPIIHAVKPNRNLAYRAKDGQTLFYYRAHKVRLDSLVVKVNGRKVGASNFTVTNANPKKGEPGTGPWKITFHKPVSGVVEFSTTDSPSIHIYGRGSLSLSNWKQNNVSTGDLLISGTVPIGSRFRNLDLRGNLGFDPEAYKSKKDKKFRPSLFRPFGLRMLVEDLTVKNGGYAVNTSARDSEFRRIEGTDVVAVVEQPPNSQDNLIEYIEGDNCLNVISGHWGGFSRIRRVTGRNILGSILLRTVSQDAEDMGPFDAGIATLETEGDVVSGFSAGSILLADNQLVDSLDDPRKMRRGALSFRRIQDPGHRIHIMATPLAVFEDVEFGEINANSGGDHHADLIHATNTRVKVFNFRAAKKIRLSRCTADHLVLTRDAGIDGCHIVDSEIGHSRLTAKMLVRWRGRHTDNFEPCLIDGQSRRHLVTFENCIFRSASVPLLHSNDRTLKTEYKTIPANWTPQSGTPLKAILPKRSGHEVRGYVFKNCKFYIKKLHA